MTDPISAAALRELLGGGMGRAIPEPETRTPRQRAVDQLTRVIRDNTELSKTHASHVEDAKAILEYVKNADEDDPLFVALTRIVFAGQ